MTTVFSKSPLDFFKNINKLPEALVNEIELYVPNIVKVFLNKKTYITNHLLIKNYIEPLNREQYIRTMIRQDNDFVLKQLLYENYNRWLLIKNYYYKTGIHSNYIVYLHAYSIDNDSPKCKKILETFFQEQGFYKNQHKKNNIRYIKWTT